MTGQVIIASFMYSDPPLFSPNTEMGNKRGSPHQICSPVRYDSASGLFYLTGLFYDTARVMKQDYPCMQDIVLLL